MSESRLVKMWWQIECRGDAQYYETGGRHDSLEQARWYLEHCIVPARRRDKCRIVRHEEHVTIAEPEKMK